jgi:uncharacterized protein (DUF58 family)
MKSSPSERLNEAARELAAPLPPLLAEAERIANTVAPGAHGRRRAGPGEAFWQFRRYVPGDPAARIDWRRSSRSDHVFVRENEWEAAQTVWLWRDGSASMRYRSAAAGAEKIARANLLLLALAVLLTRGGERAALLDGTVPPGGGQPTLRRISHALEDPAAPVPATGLPPERALPRHARLVLIGDFLDPLEQWYAAMRFHTAQGARGPLVQVLDPAEEDLPFTGRARFAGLEGDGDLLVGRVEGLVEPYRARMRGRREALAAFAHAAGWTYTSHRTDRPPASALLALHNALSGDERRRPRDAAP